MISHHIKIMSELNTNASKRVKRIPHLCEHRIEKKNCTCIFYVEARLKIHHNHIPMKNIYSSFSAFILSPLVEWYVNNIDQS